MLLHRIREDPVETADRDSQKYPLQFQLASDLNNLVYFDNLPDNNDQTKTLLSAFSKYHRNTQYSTQY